LHKRLGYIYLNTIKNLIKHTDLDLKIDINNTNNSEVNINNYITYIQSKLTKSINKAPSTKVDAYLDVLYIDIGGPIRPFT
jgi:hypothetical protein